MSLMERIWPGEMLVQIKERRTTLMPIALLAIICTAAAIILATRLIPGWRERQLLVDEVSAAQTLLTYQQEAPRPDAAALAARSMGLQAEIERIQESFVGDAEMDNILNQLYHYADNSGVTIHNLQIQATPRDASESLPHVTFRLKVTGKSTHLLGFIGSIGEASTPKLSLDNMSLSSGVESGESILMMDVRLYTVPRIPDPVTPTPEPTQTPAPADAEELEDESSTADK